MDEQQHNSILAYDATDEYCPGPPPEPQPPFWQDGSIRIGIHTSIARSLLDALDTARGIGCNALQIFSASPRMWPQRTGLRIPADQAERFRARRAELRLGPLAVHANYLINLGSTDRVIRARSLQAMHGELVRALALGADYLTVHPGSAGTRGVAAAVAAAADAIRQAARGLKLDGLRILLENTAGQGSLLGGKLDELRAVLEACDDLPMGVCLDTAHLFAAGYDLRSESGLDATLAAIDAAIGLERVFVLHVNDSKAPLGSRLDRHEHIGKGRIGRAAFARLLNHRLLAGRAFIAETPMDRPGDDRRNVAALWRLVGVKVKAGPKAHDGFPSRRRTTKVRAKPPSRKGGRKGAHPCVGC